MFLVLLVYKIFIGVIVKILNPDLRECINNGKPIKLELGSGGKRRDGFFGVDILEIDGVDAVADLNNSLSLFPDNCCDGLYSNHALEHVENFMLLMGEIHRIVRPGGKIEIIVPHFSNVYGFSDPTHVRFFGLYTMYYFVRKECQPKVRNVPVFYTATRFEISSVRIEFYRASLFDKLIYPFLKTFVNFSENTKDFYERRLSSIFHARQLRYVMSPEK